jgi:hypothetical protein
MDTRLQDEPTKVQPERNRGGRWVTLGGEAYKVPPLSFLAVQELADKVESLRSMDGGRPTASQMQTVCEIVHTAMARNYPSMKVADVAEMIDLGNYAEVLGAVLAIGGFEKRTDAPGEVMPDAPSTGTPSTSA